MRIKTTTYRKVLLVTICLLSYTFIYAQHTLSYHLYVSDTIVNYNGKKAKAIAINKQIPAPTLYFTEGDTAEIYVHNMLSTETSIHWHGLILPNQYDGVPNLTTAPIKPNETHLYKFPIVQNGTYWYHSHTKLQEQLGMYGAFIIHKKEDTEATQTKITTQINAKTIRSQDKLPEYTLVLSDWINENPYEVHRSLHNATDWYAIKKGTTQNYFQAIKHKQLKTKLNNEWKRQLAMDVSDVGYDKFLINGKNQDQYPNNKAIKDNQNHNNVNVADSIRLRIINGSSSSYFWLNYAGGKISVIANDGIDVEPVEVDRMIIAVAETYDIVVAMPKDSTAFELLATPEDRTQSASLWLGNGIKQLANKMPKLNYFEGMKMMNNMTLLNGNVNMNMMKMSLQEMDMNTVMYPEITDDKKDLVTLNYAMLKATYKTTLPNAPTKMLHFTLTGNMNRYVWTINNKTVSETDKIAIKKGENVKIILTNASMMRHPMHLHGHFFRLLNGQADYAPLKNVLDIMPMETDTIEFAATENGDWFFHCHILYHMMSGMGRIFSYQNSPLNPELPNIKRATHKLYGESKQAHLMVKVGIESNGSDGDIMLANTRYFAQTEWRLGLHNRHGYETESHVGRYFGKNQFLQLYTGYDFRYRILKTDVEGNIVTEKNLFGQTNTKDKRQVACIGLIYTLPMLINFDARIDHTSKVRIQLSRQDVALTNRLRLNVMANTDKEYSIGLSYILTKYISLSTHYDSDMGVGAGISIRY